MTQLSKYVNLLIEYGQKIENHLNKKYRAFVTKQMLNLKDLAKNVDPQNIKLRQQIIVFKLGIESKSVKGIEVSLNYLLRCFKMGFIDLNEPNYCEAYEICPTKIQKKNVDVYKKQMRYEFLQLLAPLVHFKNSQINSLMLKIYQHLIAEPILLSLIEISEQNPSQQTYELILSYCSYRIYMFEDSYYYTEDQISSFRHIPLNEKTNQQISKAMDRHESLGNLLERYVDEIVSKVAEEGGKYGRCVICGQPADYFCKVTKASLCGLECKKKHLQIAQRQYRMHYQAYVLWNSIKEMMQIICVYLSGKQSPFMFSIFAKILQNPSLFMLVRYPFKAIIRTHIPKIFDKVYQSKYEENFKTLYFLMSYLVKWWPTECLLEIQDFLKENVMKVLHDKKPVFKHMMLTFKSIDKIFQCGKSTIELFINLDTEINRENSIGQILFELSKIAQDKFQNSSFYSKQEKIALKNSCVTLFLTFAKALNEYRIKYPESPDVSFINMRKQRKTYLEQFIQKFNGHWSEGLKTLFNLNIVGLQSNQQIVNIIMTLGGLRKEMIDSMIFDKNCQQYLQIFMSRLSEEPSSIVQKLLQFYTFLPIAQSETIGKKYFIQYFSPAYPQINNIQETVHKLTEITMKASNFQQFSELVKPYAGQLQNYESIYMKALNAKKSLTRGAKNHYYQLCMGNSYLEVISSQLSLLQIPISYLLQTGYSPDKIIQLMRELIPICHYANWVSLLVKNSMIDLSNETLHQNHLKLIKGVLEIVVSEANHIGEWETFLCMISDLHLILTQAIPPNKKFLSENRSILSHEISVNLLDNCMINCSLNVIDNFARFLKAVLQTASLQLQIDRVYLLQKFFQILDVNLAKYLKVFEEVFGDYSSFVKELRPNNNETLIYISDMMKQFLLKLLKSEDIEDRITEGYFKIFLVILEKSKEHQSGREIGDFVMNCVSTIIMHHYRLKPNTWKVALTIMADYAVLYPYQTGVMIRKILNEKMENLTKQAFTIIDINFKLIDPSDQKVSIEAIHNIKMVLDYQDGYKTISQRSQGEATEEQEVKFSKEMLVYSLNELIKYLDQRFNETVIEVILNLMNFKLFDHNLLSAQEICSFFRNSFKRLEYLPEEQEESGRRILNESLYWCVKNQIFQIIFNLQELIIGKYTYLSIDAMKCIKTLIQMSNPRDEQQWKDIEQVLLNIISNTQTNRYFDLEKHNFVSYEPSQILSNSCDLSKQTSIEVNKFIYQCRLQAMAVELLPNDEKCLEVLKEAYHKKIQFNDNIELRIALWKQGLGKESPPELLGLEQIISNRIMAILLRIKDHPQILKFCSQIFQRYIAASLNLGSICHIEGAAASQCNDVHYQFFLVCKRYWQRRRIPMHKLICYVLPKIPKSCEDNIQRKQMLRNLARMLPVIDKRDPFLKCMKELTKKQF